METILIVDPQNDESGSLVTQIKNTLKNFSVRYTSVDSYSSDMLQNICVLLCLCNKSTFTVDTETPKIYLDPLCSEKIVLENGGTNELTIAMDPQMAFLSHLPYVLTMLVGRQKSMKEFDEQSDKYITVFENNSLPMCIFNKKMLTIERVNKQFANNFAVRNAGLSERGVTLSDIFDEKRIVEIFKTIKESDIENRDFEIEFRTPRGLLRNLMVSIREFSEGEEWAVFSVQDITSFVRMERAFMEVNAKIIEQNKDITKTNVELSKAQALIKDKMNLLEKAGEYKNKFLSSASHELRTPLNSVLVLAEYLMSNQEGNLNENQIESAEIIFQSSSNLLSLINDILDLSKIEAGKMDTLYQSLELYYIQKELEKIFSAVAVKKSLSLSFDLSSELPDIIITDKKKIMHILTNLMSNAIKFTHKGGVELVMYRPEKTIGNIKKPIAFAVMDSGVGIPEKEQEFIFEPFRQGSENINYDYGGTGLGLAICKEFAELLGGEISLSSELGIGSTFTVILPEKNSDNPIDKNFLS